MLECKIFFKVYLLIGWMATKNVLVLYDIRKSSRINKVRLRAAHNKKYTII